MLLSFALIILSGYALAELMKKMRLPALLGMMLAGVLLGPYVFNIIDHSILDMSHDLRQIALIIILLRAGLDLKIKDLKRIGKPALLLSFVPASLEILAVVILSPLLFQTSRMEAALMGTILAAVSPAIIVPSMLNLINNGLGEAKRIPQLILAGASVDDVYVIILFNIFLSIAQGKKFNLLTFVQIPVSIILGLCLGSLISFLVVWIFKKVYLRSTIKTLLVLALSFLLLSLEELLKPYLPLSGLLGVMALGITILQIHEPLAKSLANKLSKLWVLGELILFALLGAAININYVTKSGAKVIILIGIALLFRILGVVISLIKTNLNRKERIFVSLAYLPKATVQATIGAIPLSLGLASGDIILTVAVLAITITAPLGSILIDVFSKKLLN